MTDQLIPFLRDMLKRVTPFATLISHIHLKELDDGRLFAKATASDGTVHLTSTSKQKIDLGGARACLGNLMYLSNLLNADMLRGKNITVVINARERNDKQIVTTLQFVPNNRMEINYVATDPFRASITRPMEIKVDEWPIAFILDQESFKEFTDFKRIHAAAPSTGKEDVIQLSYADDQVAIDFGEGGISHTSTLILNVEAVSETNRPLGIHLLSDQFLRSLTQFQGVDSLIEVYMAPKAVKLNCETDWGDHELVLTGRKLRND